jgi:hypothetical protein
MSRSTAGRKTLGWLALLLAALALIAWQLRNPVAPTVDADDKLGEPLVSAAYADWAAVELLQRGERQRFERDAAGLWLRHGASGSEAGEAADAAGHVHRSDPAEAERIGAVLATFARAKVERSMAADPSRLAGYGLANPALILLVHGRDGRVLQTVELGDVAPDGLSRYLQVPQTRQLHTIPNYHATGLLSLLAAPVATAGTAPAGSRAAASAPAGASAP